MLDMLDINDRYIGMLDNVDFHLDRQTDRQIDR